MPSVFTPVALPPGADALAEAVALAPRQGAGTLTWLRGADHAAAAVVLEPERALAEARLAWLAGAAALADALSLFGPAEIPLGFYWPGELRVNGAQCGAVRLLAPPGARPEAVPDWLVLGFSLRLAFPPGHESGRTPEVTSLREEGFEDITAAELTAGWARHLMAGLDEWQARGSQRVAERYLVRLLAPEAPKRGIDLATVALVLDRDGTRERLELPA